jgi:hypothetical protein
MQESQTLRGLLDEVLRMSFIETMRSLLLERLQQVATSSQLEDNVEAIGILKMFFWLHHMRMAAHEICKSYLAERHLTKLW